MELGFHQNFEFPRSGLQYQSFAVDVKDRVVVAARCFGIHRERFADKNRVGKHTLQVGCKADLHKISQNIGQTVI